MINTRRWAVMALFTAACGTAQADRGARNPGAAQSVAAPRPAVAAAREAGAPARTRARFDELYARYQKLPEGAERAALAVEVDAAAAQRYAHVSGLYWHTDLDAALAEAKTTGKPILSLRMLGRLDDERSCINSRFFRVALYANEKIAAALAQGWVLHWSTERPVPLVTIDMGDGRTIERTLAGNSAHYVLDAQGRPVDVLPGLYAPGAFLRALDEARPLAIEVGALAAGERVKTLRAYHAAAEKASLARLQKPRYGGVSISMVDGSVIGPVNGLTLRGPQIMVAEVRTVSKASTESGFARSVLLGETRTQSADWVWAAYAGQWEKDAKLDARSRELIRRLGPTDWTAAAAPLGDKAFAELVAAFELRIALDTAMNEIELRRQVHRWFIDADPTITASFAALNQQVYAGMYATPATDPWLGLGERTIFTALPRDGIALPR